ncbi:protein MIZU-KUSSEI 1-like [Senna tora]|uniref:Protein MIZU-KUSSEI 1-like n=1 Tax=Senna tora TaxID=362788 RepID=A0A835CI61_9FABA|nr:protein MIZU-KUSSEI 1-like [Senna tora]
MKHKSSKLFQTLRSALCFLPNIITPVTLRLRRRVFSAAPNHRDTSSKITGTFFGYRNKRASFVIQEVNPKSHLTFLFVLELPVETHVLLHEEIARAEKPRMSLECEKQPEGAWKMRLFDEPLWTVFCNGKKCGFAARREATEDDLAVMELLDGVVVGEGVVPGPGAQGDKGHDGPEPDREMGYLRAHFQRVVDSKDSETLSMLGPDGDWGPGLTIFFTRI